MIKWVNISVFFVLLSLCTITSKAQTTCDTLTYAFFGHTYDWRASGGKVDARIASIDMSQFDGIWLGGDVCSESTLKYSTLQHIDSIFDLGSDHTHWALGNHDTRNTNLEWIEEFTNKPRYYATSKNGLTIMVMDGNISPLDCENLNKQYEIIKQVCDTIQTGTLIFLAHHGVYENVPGVANPDTYGHSRLRKWNPNCYHDSTTYLNTIYPMLVDVEAKGVDVVHIMGDVGAGPKSFIGISNDSIQYFGSGVNNTKNLSLGQPITNPDLALILKYCPTTHSLNWIFRKITDL